MKRYRRSGLLIVLIMAAFWAYTIIDTLMRDISKGVTHIDVGAIFVLGFTAGIALGLVLAFRGEQSQGGTEGGSSAF